MSSSGMSQRVMNMKFMRAAESRAAKTEEQETEKRIKDTSEWSLPASRVAKIKKRSPVQRFESIGYSSLNALAQDNETPVGRKSFGSVKEAPKEETTEPKKESKDKIDKALEEMWAEELTPGKRKSNLDDKPKKKQKKKSKGKK